MSQDLVVVLDRIVLNRIVGSLLQYGEDVSVYTARRLIKVVDIGSQHNMLLARELPIETECPLVKRVLDTAACIVRQAARRVAAKRECRLRDRHRSGAKEGWVYHVVHQRPLQLDRYRTEVSI